MTGEEALDERRRGSGLTHRVEDVGCGVEHAAVEERQRKVNAQYRVTTGHEVQGLVTIINMDRIGQNRIG